MQPPLKKDTKLAYKDWWLLQRETLPTVEEKQSISFSNLFMYHVIVHLAPLSLPSDICQDPFCELQFCLQRHQTRCPSHEAHNGMQSGKAAEAVMTSKIVANNYKGIHSTVI